MKPTRVAVLTTALTALLGGASLAHAQTTLYSQALPGAPGIPAGGAYVPPGNLYDNEQSNGTTSLVSQDSSGTFEARTADNFSIPAGACASGVFDISRIRVQMVQADAAPQAFGVDLFDDNGTGNAPTAGINPIATYPQTSQTSFGAFGPGTSIYEAEFNTAGLQLNADTTYWVSGFGTDAAANAAGFNNYMAASAGASGTTANGVVIAPGAGVADWTAVEAVIGGTPLAFSFAIDGACGSNGVPAAQARELPTLSQYALLLLAMLMGGVGAMTTLRRRRES